MRWYDVELIGEAVHAGPTPMANRRDPVQAMHAIMAQMYQCADELNPWARVTIGDVKFEPGSRNTVPARILISVDLRHPDEAVLDEMATRLVESVSHSAQQAGVAGIVHEEWKSPAISFDAHCVDAVEQATRDLALSAMRMVSGAGHDSVYLSRVAPTAMIFVPCKDGVSHNESESAEKGDLAAGCDVLLNAVARMSGHRTL